MEDKPTGKIERRFFPASEIRVKDLDKKPRLEGYAAVFDSMSDELWGFREKIAPGAFSRAIKENQDVRALWNHDANYVLGRTKSGTLEMGEDGHGLKIAVIPPDTTWARDLLLSIDRGDVTQMSFGFMVRKDEWEEKKNGTIVRTIKDVDLFDVSPVTFPAYPATEVQLRSLLETAQEEGRILVEENIESNQVDTCRDCGSTNIELATLEPKHQEGATPDPEPTHRDGGNDGEPTHPDGEPSATEPYDWSKVDAVLAGVKDN